MQPTTRKSPALRNTMLKPRFGQKKLGINSSVNMSNSHIKSLSNGSHNESMIRRIDSEEDDNDNDTSIMKVGNNMDDSMVSDLN